MAARAWDARSCDVQVRDATRACCGRVPYLTLKIFKIVLLSTQSNATKCMDENDTTVIFIDYCTVKVARRTVRLDARWARLQTAT